MTIYLFLCGAVEMGSTQAQAIQTSTSSRSTNMKVITLLTLLSPGVAQAVSVLAIRDAVYYDPGAFRWVCNVPANAAVQTPFGEVFSA